MSAPQARYEFSGIVAKLDRAKERLIELDDMVADYLDSHPYSPVIYHKPGTQSFSIAWRVVRQPPNGVAIVVGELLYNLRSSLDHLAWQLVKEAGNTPSVKAPRTQFPIFTVRPAGPVTIPPGIDGAAQAIINEVQPFHEGQFADEHALAVLNELGNRDKHRHLNLAVANLIESEVYVSDPTAGWRIGGRFVPGLVEHDDVIGQFTLPEDTPVDPKWEIEASGKTFVRLDETGPWDDVPLTLVLEAALIYVTAEVIEPLVALY
jgi:hypothetical protein